MSLGVSNDSFSAGISLAVKTSLGFELVLLERTLPDAGVSLRGILGREDVRRKKNRRNQEKHTTEQKNVR